MYNLTLKEYKCLFNRLYTPLCLFANKYIDDLEVCKDIVQDVFVKIWENKVVFKTENNTKSYLYTSVRNKSLDYLKSKRYKSTDYLSPHTLEELEKEPFFLREVVVAEVSNIIDNAINSLPHKCAQIIKLSVKDLNNAEIAEQLNISIHTVKAQKRNAYVKLKPILKDYFVLLAFIFN